MSVMQTCQQRRVNILSYLAAAQLADHGPIRLGLTRDPGAL